MSDSRAVFLGGLRNAGHADQIPLHEQQSANLAAALGYYRAAAEPEAVGRQAPQPTLYLQAARRKAGGFSLGMRQRLGIAAALLGDPPVLMFDEPFNGMDPEGIVWMRGFLRSLAAQGRAVLVSSHLMSELQDAADRLVVVGRGRVIADASVAELIAAASADRVTVRTAARDEAMTVLARAGAEAAATARDVITVAGLTPERVVKLLSESSVPFTELSAHRASLEEAYMELTRDAVEFRAEAAS